jgi:hypothetical protein
MTDHDRAQLSSEQKASIRDDGFVVVEQVVPPEKVAAALRIINASLGEKGMAPEELPTLRAQSYCREITGAPEITSLLTETPLWQLAESAIGAGELEPVDYGQIALRFPGTSSPGPIHPHIDGMYTPLNGVPEGQITNFTALVGVYLSDVPEDNWGNFTVWPGSHRTYADYFEKEGAEALLRGMPPVELAEPVQVKPRAGDAVFSHYQIGHGIAPNTGPNIRYAIYFRLKRRGHDAIRTEVMTDIWREWDGMSEVVAKTPGGARV